MSEEFGCFFERTMPLMVARAAMICGNMNDAENAVQDAFVIAADRWPRISEYESPDGWLHGIVRQRALAETRSRLRRWNMRDHRAPVSPPAPVTESVWMRVVLQAVRRLPTRQRQALVLHAVHGLTYQEIADDLGLSRGTVASTISKARENLRKRLGIPPGRAALEDSLVPALDDEVMQILRRADGVLEAVLAADDELHRRLRDAVHAGERGSQR